MERIETIEFNGYQATVIIPEKPNGEWIWKTEFLYAFDQSERALLNEGYTRVYYDASDRYGSYQAVRMMHNFYRYVIKEFSLREKCHLFGFSRGGLYAVNFSLYYPEYVASIYLDAPVLDMKSWPPKGSKEQEELFEEYTLNEETLLRFKENPVDNLEELFALNLPVMLVAGAVDELVPLNENGGVMIDFCEKNNLPLTCIIKPECGHHPHSLEDIQPIVDFVKKHSGIK